MFIIFLFGNFFFNEQNNCQKFIIREPEIGLNAHIFILLIRMPAVLRHLNLGEKKTTEDTATRPVPLNSSKKKDAQL